VRNWPEIVESFPLSVLKVIQNYTLIPDNKSGIFYHYTTMSGIEGILRSGGLRASYRMGMNDHGEFDYAKRVIFEELKRVAVCDDFPSVAHGLATYVRKNLDAFLDNTTETSSAYCACLTSSPDDNGQWETYADNGVGYAIGFDLFRLLKTQHIATRQHKPYAFCAPVIYDKLEQCKLVWHLVEAGINDLQAFGATRSKRSEDLTALRDRIMREIFIELFVAIDFIKAPCFRSEREVRLILDLNDGTFNAPNIQHYGRSSQSIPYIFLDFRDASTGWLPLAEIRIGPRGSFSEKKAFLDGLLDELGYDNKSGYRPRIE